jgi:antitoxin ParD1/3/4
MTRLLSLSGRRRSIIGLACSQEYRLWGRVKLANFCQNAYLAGMSTMNISLPEALKSFVDEQVASRGYGTSSEYVRALIRKDQERQRLRDLLLEGAASAPGSPADGAYFDALREGVRRRKPA